MFTARIRILLLLVLGVGVTSKSMAQTSLDVSDLSIPTKIAPAYFGPNAFPVPDMIAETISGDWKFEVYADNFMGKTCNWNEDYTANAFIRLTIPLFTDKANLVIWGPIIEYFQISDEICKTRRINSDSPISNTISGDIYISTDFTILSQEKFGIDVAMRTALKTASGNDFSTARYYDNAGYFFDTKIARTFIIQHKRSQFSIAGSLGFLCWQTDNGRQNDAIMYGIKASYKYRKISLSTEYGGYIGWEKDGDAPMTLKTNICYSLRNIDIGIGHQIGFRDWPFHQLRLGITYKFDKL